ncbi:MAG: hypothetical protein AMJ81_12490 [Phycisphaerae bacterium SM23_33]|nr:MAG: hypothetical protein AMJ81_12490 [Phycisphaerae bacterium SM23_33]
MKSQRQADEKALTPRSALVALGMVTLWTLGCCFMVGAGGMRTQHLLMVVGFGAILTVFLLQFPRLFLVSVVVICIGTAAMMVYGGNREDYPVFARGWLRSLLVIVPLLGLAVWLHFRPLRKGELAVVYACVVIAIPWCVCVRAVIESSAANLFESQRKSEPQLYVWARDLPWWGPSVKPPPRPATQPATGPASAAASQPKSAAAGGQPATQPATAAAEEEKVSEDERITREAVQGFARGNGGRVPWRLWWRPMLFWVGMCLAWQGMLMGLLLMFRKRFIEHERLPMVWSQPAIEIIKGPESGRRSRRQWILFAIGLGICLPSVIFMSPRGEALSSWSCPPWAGEQNLEGIRGGVDLTGLNLLPNTQLRLWWGPVVLAMFLLFPVDVLMTTALTYVLLDILLPGLMRSFGIAVGPNLLAGFVKNALRFGGGVGLLFWSVFFNRRTIWGYVRSLWGGRPTDACSDDELPRKLILLIFLGGLAAFFAMGWYASNALEMGLLTLLVLIYSFSQLRLRIEGMPLTYDNNFGSGPSTGCRGASTGR